MTSETDTNNITVVLPAFEIPDGSIVRKVEKGVELVLRHSITVHSGIKDKPSNTLKSDDCLFLINPRNGDINTIPTNKRLNWTTTRYNLYRLLEDEFEQ